MITLTVNGKERRLPGETDLLDYLKSLDIDARLVAVAYNGEVVPRKHYGEVRLRQGDTVEIVRMVGGGEELRRSKLDARASNVEPQGLVRDRQSVDVIIVGGGVIGCTIAYYLSKGGASVAVVERGEVGGEASGAAAGMLVPPAAALPGGPLRDLCLASLGAFPSLVGSLQQETGVDVQFLTAGILVVAETEEQGQGLRQIVGRRELGLFGFEWLEGEPLRLLEPGLSPALPGAAYSPGQHHVNPGHLTQALARAAAARGAELHQGTAVKGLLTRGGRVMGVRTGAGTIPADNVVLAAGPWTGVLARRLGVNVPTRPMRGQMLAYRSSLVRNMISGTEGYLVPKAGGFLFAGATVEDVGFRRRTTKRALAGLRRMARTLVPSLRQAPVVDAWAGLRPGSPDGLPILGPVPGVEGLWVATGHFRNGILLAPVTGELMARSILKGRAVPELAPFSPSRFAAG